MRVHGRGVFSQPARAVHVAFPQRIRECVEFFRARLGSLSNVCRVAQTSFGETAHHPFLKSDREKTTDDFKNGGSVEMCDDSQPRHSLRKAW